MSSPIQAITTNFALEHDFVFMATCKLSKLPYPKGTVITICSGKSR